MQEYQKALNAYIESLAYLDGLAYANGLLNFSHPPLVKAIAQAVDYRNELFEKLEECRKKAISEIVPRHET